MKVTIKSVAAYVFPLLITVALAAVIIFSAVPSCGGKVDFSATFYYVCYNSPTDAQSAASVAGVVHSYGGAGYIVENGGKHYVTIACYYEKKDADTVCNNLGGKGLSCTVIEVSRDSISLPPSARSKAQSYKGTMNTLASLSKMCYDLANGMDSGEHNQASAKSILGEIGTGLDGLYRANKSNCFSEEISALLAERDDVCHGYVFSYDVRRLQIAICDCIINVRLY